MSFFVAAVVEGGYPAPESTIVVPRGSVRSSGCRFYHPYCKLYLTFWYAKQAKRAQKQGKHAIPIVFVGL